MAWSGNLYEKTDFPDNYTPDDCFLAAIRRNKNLSKYNLRDSIHSAAQVSLQFGAVSLFVSGYIYLKQGWIGSGHLLAGVCTLACLGYLWARPSSSIRRDLRHLVIFICFGFGLAPVLYKLTDTISTDTIHTMSWNMLFLHLLLHNYSRDYEADPLSLNAALFSAVCLASRLDSSWDAFVLLSVAVVLLVLFPMARARLEKGLWAVGLMSGLALMVAWAIAWKFALGVALVLTFVTFIAPFLFVQWQSHKDTIHGPWDEAVPQM